jgi:predicted kinase
MTTTFDENTRTKQLVLLRGLPGSGKSTFARAWVDEDPDFRVRVNRDDIRFALFGKYWDLSQHQEETVSTIEHATSTAALKSGLSVIIDATNFKASGNKDWISAADRHKAEFVVVDIETPVEECIRRDRERISRQVGEQVIRDFAKRYLQKGKFPPKPVKMEQKIAEVGAPYEHTEGLPFVWLFDVDGTLARMQGRSPFAWHRVGEDTVIEDVARVARILSETYPIIIFSGRDEVCKPETSDWLREVANVDFKEIHMRPTSTNGVDLPDDVVKLDLFEQHIRGKYNVAGVFDDRLRVCRAWENLGLTLFRVGPLDSAF